MITFLPWVGSKRRYISLLSQYIPPVYNRYFEVFFGSGALFFSLDVHHAIVSDKNEELMNMFRQVRDNVDELISTLKSFKWADRKQFEILKSNKSQNDVSRASRFLLLVKSCYSNMYRVNSKNEFNGSFNSHRKHSVDYSKLLEASDKLKVAAIRNLDFEEALEEEARKGDFVFIDPPYASLSSHRTFCDYTSTKFTFEDQIRLAACLNKLTKKGVKILMTNSSEKEVRNLFYKFNCEVLDRFKCTVSNASDNKNLKEAIYYNYEVSKLKDVDIK